MHFVVLPSADSRYSGRYGQYPIANLMISATLEMRVVLQKFHRTERGSDHPISLQSLLGLLARCSEVLMIGSTTDMVAT